jgi:hypothetical protein
MGQEVMSVCVLTKFDVDSERILVGERITEVFKDWRSVEEYYPDVLFQIWHYDDIVKGLYAEVRNDVRFGSGMIHRTTVYDALICEVKE